MYIYFLYTLINHVIQCLIYLEQPIYDNPRSPHFTPDACSLRRTRSLAVIREETFNDLQINGTRARRSQLIPRAKLVERAFFEDEYFNDLTFKKRKNFIFISITDKILFSSIRFNYKFKSEDVLHEINNEHLHANELKARNSPVEYENDKSDLDSLDSNYFKHSLHQSSTTEIEIHHSTITLADTTTSDSSDNYSTKREESESIKNIKRLEEILSTEEGSHSGTATTTTQTSTDSFETDSCSAKQTLVIELKEEQRITKEDLRSVISYDSIYLSSESSEKLDDIEFIDDADELDGTSKLNSIEIHFEDYENINIPSEEIKQKQLESFEEENIEENKEEKENLHNVSIDSLYTEVAKTKPRIISLEPKRLTSFSDYSSNGTLEKLTFITTGQFEKTGPTAPYQEHHYYSLPDVQIGQNLIASERIDAKLREICDEHLEGKKEIFSSEYQIYDSISRFGRAHKRLRQRENCEIVILNSISIDEQPKESPSIEVEPVVKKIPAPKTEYLKELGLDSDCGTLKSTFSYQANLFSDQQPPTTINLGGKQVIIEEVKKNTKIPEIRIVAPESEIKVKEMSRPQILHIVDSKRESLTINKLKLEENLEEVEQEFHEKVDSVRCYWSKLAEEKTKELESLQQNSNDNDERNFVTSVEDEPVQQTQTEPQILQTSQKKNVKFVQQSNELQSYCPTVEIIDLDGENQAAVVKSQNTDDYFDHVRYKIMKTDAFQKNLITRNKKEAQFDGLIQYLQDYSFQELLAHNNVVIIEPVRTKIEKICDKPQKSHKLSCKITGGAGSENTDNVKAHLKRHFFYHPVRVNKELLEEELPNPDTVKNVRKMFESVASASRSGRNNTLDAKIKSNESLRKRAMRYLTIDTSFESSNKKWDSASLSSGISSGDLSSPCECEENLTRFSSEENLCGGEENFDETRFVSQDILEKIRECGSSVTYYGGRVVHKKNSEFSPITKAIMQEIRSGDCSSCKPNQNQDEKTLECKSQDSDSYLGKIYYLFV